MTAKASRLFWHKAFAGVVRQRSAAGRWSGKFYTVGRYAGSRRGTSVHNRGLKHDPANARNARLTRSNGGDAWSIQCRDL